MTTADPFDKVLLLLNREGTTIGLSIFILVLIVSLCDNVASITLGISMFSRIAPSLRFIGDILAYPEERPPATFTLDETPDSFRIEFRNPGFAYRPVIKDFSLVVEPGEKVAIRGASGSGKSTLANLLLRFLAPTEGEIRFGDRPITGYPLPLYLSYFSYVDQNVYLFNTSLRENITMGWYNVPMDKLQEVLRLVRLDPMVEQLPETYDTLIRENGRNVSGGQRQRMALARALIREPAVLVLDEFTSALDREVEGLILDDLFTIFKHQTVLCITHADHVARRFDRMVHFQRAGQLSDRT